MSQAEHAFCFPTLKAPVERSLPVVAVRDDSVKVEAMSELGTPRIRPTAAHCQTGPRDCVRHPEAQELRDRFLLSLRHHAD
jgi:hypothetical protein